MTPKKTKKDFVPHIPPDKAPRCHSPGCKEPGIYKAPKSKQNLHEYDWYCLEHIREHNEKWDYFKGMDRESIEDFMVDAALGHRPTWTREQHMRFENKLNEALEAFMRMGNAARRSKAHAPLRLSQKMRKALALMDMEYPYTAKDLKMRYRALVKQHHPDVNPGNQKSEEIFKQITAAFALLAGALEHAE